jgi:hypothetical protein
MLCLLRRSSFASYVLCVAATNLTQNNIFYASTLRATSNSMQNALQSLCGKATACDTVRVTLNDHFLLMWIGRKFISKYEELSFLSEADSTQGVFGSLNY